MRNRPFQCHQVLKAPKQTNQSNAKHGLVRPPIAMVCTCCRSPSEARMASRLHALEVRASVRRSAVATPLRELREERWKAVAKAGVAKAGPLVAPAFDATKTSERRTELHEINEDGSGGEFNADVSRMRRAALRLIAVRTHLSRLSLTLSRLSLSPSFSALSLSALSFGSLALSLSALSLGLANQTLYPPPPSSSPPSTGHEARGGGL